MMVGSAFATTVVLSNAVNSAASRPVIASSTSRWVMASGSRSTVSTELDIHFLTFCHRRLVHARVAAVCVLGLCVVDLCVMSQRGSEFLHRRAGSFRIGLVPLGENLLQSLRAGDLDAFEQCPAGVGDPDQGEIGRAHV